jgi:hypothetical protein
MARESCPVSVQPLCFSVSPWWISFEKESTTEHREHRGCTEKPKHGTIHNICQGFGM